jgi:hypothetical protein
VQPRQKETLYRKERKGHAKDAKNEPFATLRIHSGLCVKALICFGKGAWEYGMGKGLSETANRARGRRSGIVLALLACLLTAGCAQRDSGAEKDPQGGFYGGISGGNGM